MPWVVIFREIGILYYFYFPIDSVKKIYYINIVNNYHL